MYVCSFVPDGLAPRACRNESVEDMDLQVSALAQFALAEALLLGDVRPRWASSILPWWDLDCDRDLLLGTFLHGFGAYPKMKGDPRLCFSSKVCCVCACVGRGS